MPPEPSRPVSCHRHAMRFGAEVADPITRFRLWAPKCASVRLAIEGQPTLPMQRGPDGWHNLALPVPAGTLYKFLLPDGRLVADPASRFQPEGLFGPSEVIDPEAHAWRAPWTGRPWEEAVIYELHPGTFTPEGTWDAAIQRLDHLAGLGVTALQLMPLAQSYGAFNWGYDGALWFAPAATQGRPETLKAFIEAAHDRGLMVFLDVVYNHFGPLGNPLPELCPLLSDRHQSPWGPGLNLDDEGSPTVRDFVIDNALYWLTEYQLDGLRLDAVHEIADDSTTHLLELLAARLRAAVPHRHIHLIVENSRNQARWLRRDAGLRPVHYTAQWNDDLHHALHAAATGESSNALADFRNADPGFDTLGRALAEGFAFQGEMVSGASEPKGEPSAGLPPTAFVSFIQNHDQIGNRVHGDRIDRLTPPAALEAITAVWLIAPQIPMLFMGQEFQATTPFPFFSDMPPDHRAETLRARQEQLPGMTVETDPDPSLTPDPTDPATFRSACLDWSDPARAEGRAALALHRALLDLRRAEIVPRLPGMTGFSGTYQRLARNAVRVDWRMGDGATLRLFANLSTARIACPPVRGRQLWLSGQAAAESLGPWTALWTLEV